MRDKKYLANKGSCLIGMANEITEKMGISKALENDEYKAIWAKISLINEIFRDHDKYPIDINTHFANIYSSSLKLKTK